LNLFAEAIKRNPPTSVVTESEFQHELVRFLRGAVDRNGGRKERQLTKDKKAQKKGGPYKNKLLPTGGRRIEYSSSDDD
jgi:hypothetical protein